MIVLFQMILCTGKQLFQYIFAKIYSSYYPCKDDFRNKVKCIYEGDPASYDSERGLRFSPPLYSQRYLAVQDVMKDDRWMGELQKVVDFGCAELKFFKYSKNVRGVKEVLEVDIQSTTLECNIYRVQPLISDFIQRRSEALDVSVLAGSIKDPDPRLLNTDMVVAIEIIEHLYPDTLEAIPYNIFEFIKPCVVVFTTPNADFNILFPSFNKFRHDDHKFEWTRQQFQDWANNIVARFPDYIVSFDGVGALPTGTLENLGCCTQMAIFYNENYKSRILREDDDYKSYGICTYRSYTSTKDNPMYIDDNFTRPCYYKLITEVNFPFEEIDETSRNDKIRNEVAYRLSIYGAEYGLYFNYNKWRSEVPIAFLHTFVRDSCTVDELVMILKENYVIENRLIDDTIQMCIIYEIKDDLSDTSSNSSDEMDDQSRLNIVADEDDSDWETIQYSTPKYSEASLIISRAFTDDNMSDRITEEDGDIVQSADVAINCNLSDEFIADDYLKTKDKKCNPVQVLVDDQVIDKIKLKNEITLYVPKSASSLNKFKENQIISDSQFVSSDSLLTDDTTSCSSSKDTSDDTLKPFLNLENSLSPIAEYRAITPSQLKLKLESHGNGSHKDKHFKLFKSNSKHIEINVKLKNSKSSLSACQKLKAVLPVVAVHNQPEQQRPPHVPPQPPRVVENGDLINNNRDGEGNNYEAESDDDDGFENNLENWNFDQHNKNHIIREDQFDPIIPEHRPKDAAAEHVIEHVVHGGKKMSDDILKDLTERVTDQINYQTYHVNEFSTHLPSSDRSKYSVYFRNDTYREVQQTAGQSSSSLEVNTSNGDVDEVSVSSEPSPAVQDNVIVSVATATGSGTHQNMLQRENSLIPEPFPEWLRRLMPANMENPEDLDYLSQGDNLTVNPNDDDFEESSTDSSHDADNEDDGLPELLDVDDSDHGLTLDAIDTSSLMLQPVMDSQRSLTNIESIDTEEYYFDTFNDIQSEEFMLAVDTIPYLPPVPDDELIPASQDTRTPAVIQHPDLHPPT